MVTPGRWRWTPANELAILVEAWATSEDPFDNLLTVWDRYDHLEPLLLAGFKPDEIVRVREAFLSTHNLHGIIPPDEDMQYQLRIFQESHDFVVPTIKDMLGTVLGRLPDVSGDDEFYDYYPDMFSIMDQIVLSAGQAMPTERSMLEAALNLVRQIAVDFRYYDPAESAWEHINADMRFINDRDRKIRHGWLAMVQNEHGQFVWRYTPKYIIDHNLSGLQLPEWVVR